MSAINSLAGAASVSVESGNRFNDLSSDEFVRIMVAELSNQDPFAPNDSAAILEQLSSIRNIESQTSLHNQLEVLVSQNAIASASGLIGKTIVGLDVNNHRVEGLVTSLRIENGKPILVLEDGSTIPTDRLTAVGSGEDFNAGIVQQLISDLVAINPAALIGKTVSGTNDKGQTVEGAIRAIRREDGRVLLELTTDDILPVSSVKRLMDAGTLP